ncbi:MAG: serine protein kinase, partial [Planctomycetes bacterium]|nr:serine protein kinase [Planctomycetota bacterium]
MSNADEVLRMIGETVDPSEFLELHWAGSFKDYLELVYEYPLTVRNAHQRLYDMILSFQTEEYTRYKEKITRYRFFDDPFSGGKDAVYGLDRALMRLVRIFKSAAHGYGAEKRVLLLHGPVGSAKSTIVRLLKKGLEAYSRQPAGALYTYEWRVADKHGERWVRSPMNEEPLKLVPPAARARILADLNDRIQDTHTYRLQVDGDLNPFCRYYHNHYLAAGRGDWNEVVQNVRIRRLVLSEKDRIGIGTFQPKDEKNQDSTELTGDINYRLIAEYGSDSDPRAFNFDGEFNVANRGLVEFIEVLKLDVAFLYDLLGASQEHSVKPKKFNQTSIDEVIIGHTNEPEYRKLQTNELMEAFRDRTVKIDIPYNTVLQDEIKIYQKEYNERVLRAKRIAPHTIEMAAMWAVLTRLAEPKKANLTLLQKLKLYNGKTLPGFTEDNIQE